MNEVIPKKALGQHWLRDEAALDAVIDCADVHAGDAVLEIGPGLGTLTRRLLARGARVTAVEFDATLSQNLTKNLREDSPPAALTANLTVVNENILRFDLTQLPPGYKVAANIPYYLTSNLVRVLTESANPFSRAALLVQREVAERAVARPGRMSLLSVGAQYYCDVSLGPVVPARLFTPPPKVDSQVLVLHYRPAPLFGDSLDAKLFFRLVRAGFSQKRKTLENALSGGLQLPKTATRQLCQTANIPPGQRAQALSLDDWHELYKAFTP